MPAVSRNTQTASKIEYFLDDNEEDLSPKMFRELEGVASEVDSMVTDLEKQIEYLKGNEEYLMNQIKELEENQND